MIYLLVLGALISVPILLIIILRVNSAIAFMSLALGSVLVSYTSTDVTAIATSLSSKVNPGTKHWVSLVLLVVPFLLTILFTRKSISGKKRLTNFLPAVACGLLFALLITPLLSHSLQVNIESLHIWRSLSNLQTLIILIGAFLSLIFLLVTHRHHHCEEKASKH